MMETTCEPTFSSMVTAMGLATWQQRQQGCFHLWVSAVHVIQSTRCAAGNHPSMMHLVSAWRSWDCAMFHCDDSHVSLCASNFGSWSMATCCLVTDMNLFSRVWIQYQLFWITGCSFLNREMMKHSSHCHGNSYLALSSCLEATAPMANLGVSGLALTLWHLSRHW